MCFYYKPKPITPKKKKKKCTISKESCIILTKAKKKKLKTSLMNEYNLLGKKKYNQYN